MDGRTAAGRTTDRGRAGGDQGSAADTVQAVGEFALIGRITAGVKYPESVQLGPGDDAAILAAPDGRVVVSTDVLVDGVHFRTDWASPEQIGRRAALAAMADISAMGAVPTGLVVGLSAPADTAVDVVLGIGKGLHDTAAEHGAAVVGGDVTRSPALTLSVTVLGDLRGERPVTRSGARSGDVVALAGRLGWAAAGLTVLSRGFRSPVSLVNAYRVPEPPLAAGPTAAASGATSMIDVSDGLLADLGHVARASGVDIDVRTIALDVNPRLTEVASALGRDALDWVLTGGDDHALVATFPHGATLPPGWQPIGSVTVADPSGPRVTVDGAVREGATGWTHFGSA
ncbi:thiamine-phosphate kinase [Nakamurella sp. YIM 132087]|uniref:Thiamine-monophosphate kinase n=1 Tax=Nakamurella alba TaxID=2665158 RepID=A0A7K1FG85_9ACTN|nr:thiamine-phosphate kinase [Nakamurella alba]MTD13117.1 thiamine-phosphate kinase [Nakamurella alba]